MIPGRYIKTEAIINGQIIRFDAQSIGTLIEAKAYYEPNFKYIGSTRSVYYDGEKDNDGKLHHIFVMAHRHI